MTRVKTAKAEKENVISGKIIMATAFLRMI
jgi:hypothetical protein